MESNNLTKENTIGIIIPIHPPKYKFIYNLVEKSNIINKCCDVILVFSNDLEYNQFQYKDVFKTLILPENYISKNMVTFKKYYALRTLKQTYSYYIICDSEIDIIDENFTHENVVEKIKTIFDGKTIFAGNIIFKNNTRVKLYSTVIEYSSGIFKSDEDKMKLKHLTNDYSLYYWWSDLPVVKGSHIDDFFSKINYDMDLDGHHFDHVIYLNYLLLYHNFKFTNITSLIGRNGSLESYTGNNIKDWELLKENSCTFSWVVPKLFRVNKEYFLKNGTFLLYHLDRDSVFRKHCR